MGGGLGNGLTLGAMGFVGGTYFASVLRLMEGRSRFDQLSLPRFSVWGAVGGAALGGVAAALGLWGAGVTAGLGVMIVGVSTVLGAASAAGTLAIARVADPRLPDAGVDVDAIGLSEEEARRLLG